MNDLLPSSANMGYPRPFLFGPICRPTSAMNADDRTSGMLGRIIWFVTLLCLISCGYGDDKCFCQLKGQIDDCCSSVEIVNKLNNLHIYPRLSALVRKSHYFKYYKVNLNKKCPFWSNQHRCALKDCSVDICSDDEIPIGLKFAKEKYSDAQDKHFRKRSSEQKKDSEQCAGGDLETLGDVNATISDIQLDSFDNWSDHDDSEDKFCDIDDESGSGMKYVDLTLNPERYTGYAGSAARKIWNSIYKENCFMPPNVQKQGYKGWMSQYVDKMCLERRVFFRAISGMHASINIHLSYKYLISGSTYGKKFWGPNVAEFRRRFDPETTNNEGPGWLKNLYTTYLLVLRAITKAKPYWEHEDFYTGHEAEDIVVKDMVMDIVESASKCPSTFDESLMFSGDPKQAKYLKDEFRSHFYNITRIMDCVGCDKCRLWGKLQTQGLGTALKILFSSDDWERIPIVKGKQFKLSRNEIVSLFNALGRFSSSVHALRKFKVMK